MSSPIVAFARLHSRTSSPIVVGVPRKIIRVGDRARSLRLRAGLSVDELAQRTGVNRATLYRIESGRRPHMKTARALADALGITVAEFLGEEVAA